MDAFQFPEYLYQWLDGMATADAKHAKNYRQLAGQMHKWEAKSVKYNQTKIKLDKLHDTLHDEVYGAEYDRNDIQARYFLTLLPYTSDAQKNLTPTEKEQLKKQILDYIYFMYPEQLSEDDISFQALFNDAMDIDFNIWKCERLADLCLTIKEYFGAHGIAFMEQADEFPESEEDLFEAVVVVMIKHYQPLRRYKIARQEPLADHQTELKKQTVTFSNRKLMSNLQSHVYESQAYHFTQLAEIAQRSGWIKLRVLFSKESRRMLLQKDDDLHIRSIFEYFELILLHEIEREEPESGELLFQLDDALKSGTLASELPQLALRWLEAKTKDPELHNEIRKICFVTEMLRWSAKMEDNRIMRLRMEPIYEMVVDQTGDYSICTRGDLNEEILENNLLFTHVGERIEEILESEAAAIHHIKALIQQSNIIERQIDNINHWYFPGEFF